MDTVGLKKDTSYRTFVHTNLKQARADGVSRYFDREYEWSLTKIPRRSKENTANNGTSSTIIAVQHPT